MADDFLLRWLKPWKPRAAAPTEIVEYDLENAPIQQAAKLVLRRGRSVNLTYDAAGRVRLRRRLRQVTRTFGHGVQWRASRHGEVVPAFHVRWKRPWWWL